MWKVPVRIREVLSSLTFPCHSVTDRRETQKEDSQHDAHSPPFEKKHEENAECGWYKAQGGGFMFYLTRKFNSCLIPKGSETLTEL